MNDLPTPNPQHTENEQRDVNENVKVRGIQSFFVPLASNNNSSEQIKEKVTLGDKAVKGEIKIALKAIEANWSYGSLNNICEVLCDIAPDSLILKKMQMKDRKLSYLISHGLGPHFRELLAKDVRSAPCYVLGLDSATSKQLGLSKCLDFKLRFFSERFNLVSSVV